MTTPPGFLSTRQAADRLGLTRQRVHEIAKTYDWTRYSSGRDCLWAERDVDVHAMRMEAQKAWQLLGIPPSQWARAELADADDFETFKCPECGELAYLPAPGSKWDHMAACPSCGWVERR